MKSILLAAILLAAILFGASPAVAEEKDRERQLRLVRETDPLTPEQQQARMHVPEGFTIQVFASEPMINKPINLAFDERGRLWVSSNTEYPYAAKKERWADAKGSRVKDSRDAIKILEDTDGDGRADKVTDFADGLNVPTGVLPWHKPEHKAGCIAWSIPNLWYFADTDGDGKCDLREVLFGPLGYEKDTHGMCSSFRLGADGWVYATHGFNNTSHFKARDGSSLDLHSGNVFRFRPDGSRVEPWSWGQVNPFGLCWDRRGNLYSADCHSNPVTQLIGGAYYPSFGKPHDGLGFAPVMCRHGHGSTGLCGLAYVDGGIWGPEWDDHLFLGNCVTSRVNADHVTFTGTTPQAHEKPDFVTCEDPWFRPVDLQIGPDNALYIADFYNRIIGHYEVPLDHPGRDRERGRIWRVVKDGASKTPRPALPAPVPRMVSEDDGKTWREEPPLGPGRLAKDEPFRCVFAFSTIVPLKDGSHLGMFHRAAGTGKDVTLQVVQSITRDGGFTWSPPVIACDGKKLDGKDPCEPYVFRSPDGDELCCLMRENKRSGTSLVMFSRDEGKTWSQAVDAPWGLTGDRHHGLRLPDGRFVIVFRHAAPNAKDKGLIAWVGNYDDIKQGKPGQYRVSLTKTFKDGLYPGLHLLPDGTIVATTYASLTPKENPSIVSVRFKMSEVDALAVKLKLENKK